MPIRPQEVEIIRYEPVHHKSGTPFPLEKLENVVKLKVKKINVLDALPMLFKGVKVLGPKTVDMAVLTHPQPDPLKVTIHGLALAIAKSLHHAPVPVILKKHPAHHSTMVTEWVSRLERHIDFSRPPAAGGTRLNLRPFYFQEDGLRDFSKSSSVGEMAQGLTLLFMQRELGHPMIMDFHYVFRNEWLHRSPPLPPVVPPIKAKTPDFAAYIAGGGPPTKGSATIMIESKGSVFPAIGPKPTRTIKSKLNYGLAQCASGNAHLFVASGKYARNSWSIFTEFRLTSSPHTTKSAPTRIHVVDPQMTEQRTNWNSIPALREYYEKVLLAFGYPENPSLIWWDIDRFVVKQRSFDLDGMRFVRVAEQRFPRHLGSTLETGISYEMLKAIADGEPDRYFDLVEKYRDKRSRVLDVLDASAVNKFWFEYFIDGTAIARMPRAIIPEKITM